MCVSHRFAYIKKIYDWSNDKVDCASNRDTSPWLHRVTRSDIVICKSFPKWLDMLINSPNFMKYTLYTICACRTRTLVRPRCYCTRIIRCTYRCIRKFTFVSFTYEMHLAYDVLNIINNIYQWTIYIYIYFAYFLFGLWIKFWFCAQLRYEGNADFGHASRKISLGISS